MSRKLGAEAPAQPTESLRVLIADDAAEIRLLLRRSLELDGSVEVIGEASNGAEAVKMVESSKPDIVLLDLAMPVMDGLRAIPAIRKSSPSTQVVVLSAFNASKMEQRAYDAGATAFISKASGPDAILATLREVTRRAGAADETVHPVRRAKVPGSKVSQQKTISLETAYRRKHDLLPTLSHEIGNQLTVIQGFAEMLLDGLGNGLPPETARQFAESIVRNAKQMGGLLETVSEVRKLDLGIMELQIVDVDLGALVRQATPDLESHLGARRVTLNLTEAAIVPADQVRVRQILAILTSNVGKFTPSDAQVQISVISGDDRVELAVSDNGPGIPADQQGQLFQKFARLDARVKGAGLGLYLARGIARAHAGDLVFVPQDRGCRFVLRLPRSTGAIS